MLLVVLALLSGPPADLEWEAPPECPERAQVVATIEQLLGRPLDQPSERSVHARGRVARDEQGRFVLDLAVESPGGSSQETFVAERCASLADAVALTVALAIDPFAVVEATAEDPRAAAPIELPAPKEPPPEPGPRAPEEPPEPSSPTPPSPAPPRIRGAAWMVGGVGFGPLPGVTPAAGVAASVLGRGWRADLVGRTWLRGQARADEAPEAGVDFVLGAVGVRGCPVPMVGPVELPVCAGLDGGVARAEGVGVDEAKVAHRLWLAISVGPALVWPVTRHFALRFEAEALVPLLRPGFTIDNLGLVYRVPPSAASAWAGLEFRFP